ncbi:MAG: lamin tail domain-containing protein [Candidatus Paceibacterota bacterium]|jgi:hypothetical protein
MTNRRLKFQLFLFLFFTPVFAGAQISFSEIMYDPEGSDANSGGEWVEVQNIGSTAVDFTKWIFFENDINHGITADGASVIQPGGYAIISKDPSIFKGYFTNFSGLLFRASFSLNDGEKLAMKSNKDDLVTDANSVTYTAELGAKNDGKSLQKNSSGVWLSATPTPGSATLSDPSNPVMETTTSNQTAEQNSGASTNSIVSSFPVEPQMIVEAGANKTTVAGALISFSGIALGLKKEPIENAQYMWSFGDGSFKEGRSVTHTYRYPGEYVVVLEVSSGYFSGSDRLKVSAVTPEIIISKIGDASDYFIEVTNNSKYELDLSGWILRSQSAQFFIPKNTIIMSGGKVSFSSLVTGFSFSLGDKPFLLYPSGAMATTYGDRISEYTPQEDSESTPNIESSPVVKSVSSSKQSGNRVMAASASAVEETETKSSEQNQKFPFKWLLAVGALSIVAVLGIMFSGASSGKKPDELSADDFDIEEDVS